MQIQVVSDVLNYTTKRTKEKKPRVFIMSDSCESEWQKARNFEVNITCLPMNVVSRCIHYSICSLCQPQVSIALMNSVRSIDKEGDKT